MTLPMSKTTISVDEPAILPGDVPVEMPELPAQLVITTAEQFKAISDPIRLRILNLVRHHPATAKQLADRLDATPGAIGHHIRVLEEAGLVQVVARRITRGIIAKYYTRTARIFTYDIPQEITGEIPNNVRILTQVRDELAESSATVNEDAYGMTAFPHARLSPERIQAYMNRLEALLNDFLQEPSDPDGQIYSLCLSFFKSPAYLQAPLADKSEE